jgi:hypothetical protein
LLQVIRQSPSSAPREVVPPEAQRRGASEARSIRSSIIAAVAAAAAASHPARKAASRSASLRKPGTVCPASAAASETRAPARTASMNAALALSEIRGRTAFDSIFPLIRQDRT